MHKGSIEASCVWKRVSPFRIFKRHVAAETKIEYPNMRNEERQIIIKEKWRKIDEHEKGMFVALARLEEEKSHY